MKHTAAIAQPRRQAGFHTIGKRDARGEKEQHPLLHERQRLGGLQLATHHP